MMKRLFVALTFVTSGAPLGFAQRPFPEVPESEANSGSTNLWHNTLEPIPKAPDYNDAKAWALNPHIDPSHTLQEPKGFARRVQELE